MNVSCDFTRDTSNPRSFASLSISFTTFCKLTEGLRATCSRTTSLSRQSSKSRSVANIRQDSEEVWGLITFSKSSYCIWASSILTRGRISSRKLMLYTDTSLLDISSDWKTNCGRKCAAIFHVAEHFSCKIWVSEPPCSTPKAFQRETMLRIFFRSHLFIFGPTSQRCVSELSVDLMKSAFWSALHLQKSLLLVR